MTSSSRWSGNKLNRPFVGIPSFLRARTETDLDAQTVLELLGNLCHQPRWERPANRPLSGPEGVSR